MPRQAMKTLSANAQARPRPPLSIEQDISKTAIAKEGDMAKADTAKAKADIAKADISKAHRSKRLATQPLPDNSNDEGLTPSGSCKRPKASPVEKAQTSEQASTPEALARDSKKEIDRLRTWRRYFEHKSDNQAKKMVQLMDALDELKRVATAQRGQIVSLKAVISGLEIDRAAQAAQAARLVRLEEEMAGLSRRQKQLDEAPRVVQTQVHNHNHINVVQTDVGFEARIGR